ncbi:MAG: CDP-alcohol phosphatidyltransferase family protein [Clostridia bacterium]|nr:CDP-alcohol phosphatidyltransferase family protein [Clostridia bacterium]
MRMILKQVPNILTILRMAAVPFFVILMKNGSIYAAIGVFLAAEVTDVLDGIIARRYNLITPFGKIADPFADKLMQLTALFMLAERNWILQIIPWLVLFKELFLLISGLYLMRKNVDMSSKWFGKLTSVLFFIAIMMAFFGVARQITDTMLWVCVGMAVFASIMYIRNYFRQVGKTILKTKESGS